VCTVEALYPLLFVVGTFQVVAENKYDAQTQCRKLEEELEELNKK